MRHEINARRVSDEMMRPAGADASLGRGRHEIGNMVSNYGQRKARL